MSRSSTTYLLQKLRHAMRSAKLACGQVDAYIIPSGDAHQSEYIADYDKRRAFISGFTGSAGTAIVTLEQAALWTDGRYFLQAEQQLDDNWILMKRGVPNPVSEQDWLSEVLKQPSKVGVDPFLLSSEEFSSLGKSLASSGHKLVAVLPNLIDEVWTEQPPPPSNPVTVLDQRYTGESWQSKVARVRSDMNKQNAHVHVITALDEIAWLLNLRGSDIVYNPVFFSYVIVTPDTVSLFVDGDKLDNRCRQSLEDREQTVRILPYDNILSVLKREVELLPKGKKIWLSSQSSAALMEQIPMHSVYKSPGPVGPLKAKKNATELKGMRQAHIRDAVALCNYFMWLEQEVPRQKVTEISGATKLEQFRRQQEDFVSLSFDTISSVGDHAAIIHYKPSAETDRIITSDTVYLCDSGAQYKDGTTDVTRVWHLGTPSERERRLHTLVLKGHIALSRAVFPSGCKGSRLDSLARLPLWQQGLDYQHGTGHGVGSFLNVHEGPCGISYRSNPREIGLEEGMILSDEPGYYENGVFGFRIENLVEVVKAETAHQFHDMQFLTFKPVTLFPIQSKLICPELLDADEVQWLNDYHAKCRSEVGAELMSQGLKNTYQWLMNQTAPLG